MIKKRKIFFGWWTVLAGGIITLWLGGYQGYGFSALFKPIASELGFSRAAASVPAGIGRLEGGIEGPLSGWLTDRFGPRWLVFFGVSLASLSLILMYYVNSLWAFYVVWGVMLGTGHNIATTIPVETAISNWFVRKRGLALGVRMVLTGLSGVLVLPLIVWLIIAVGWRMTCVIGGLMMAVLGLPLAWFCFKQRRPEYYGLLPDGAAASERVAEASQMIDRGVKYAAEVQEVEFTLRQAMRTLAYWLLIVAGAAQAVVVYGINVHTMPFLTDLGIDPLRAAGMTALLMLFFSLPSRFVGGVIADRLKKRQLIFLLGGTYFVKAAGITVFLLKQSIPMALVFFMLYYFAQGIATPLTAVIRARYFGRKAFGSIQGMSMTLIAPAGVLSPIYAGWVYDTTGSYVTAFTVFAVLLAVASVIIPFARPPKPPAEITDISKIV